MRLLLASLALVSSMTCSAQNFFGDANTFFHKHVRGGLVDYRQIKQNSTELDALLDFIASAPAFEGAQEKAFLINTYNLFIIKGIVDYYPTKGPMSIIGFFNKQGFQLRGEKIALNELEKEKLTKQFPDARLHFALVCAAVGCPKLASFAYNPKELESQLEERTRNAINDPTFVKRTEKGLELSQIFKWYADDFGGADSLVIYVQKYHYGKIKFGPNHSFYPYDWNLNELK